MQTRKQKIGSVICLIFALFIGFGGLWLVCANAEDKDTCPNCDCTYKLVHSTELKSPNGPNYYTYEYECRECGHSYTLEKKVEK